MSIDADYNDWSSVDAVTQTKNSAAKSRVILSAGAAALMAGVGVGAGCFGASYLVEPKIVETTKVVTETKIERVEVPVPAPAPIPAPQKAANPLAPENKPLPPPTVGQKMGAKEMENREDYQSSEMHGRIVTVNNGDIIFDNGKSFMNLDANYNKSHWTTGRFDGAPAYCRDNGSISPANGRPMYNCYATVNGVVVMVARDPNEPS